MSEQRKFDVILWGATGFTGKLVAEYLLSRYGVGDQLKWALAGRNSKKLHVVREDLNNPDIPILTADIDDKQSLANMVQSTKVICTTVGPYAKYGTQLVKSCVQHNTDYCDLTGEVQWMRRTIDTFHEEAQKGGTKIVHTCGFDSVPSDMGVYFIQEQMKKRQGEYSGAIKFRVKAAKGGMSGGTLASLDNVLLEAEKDPSIFKILNDPYALNPERGRKGPDRADLLTVAYDKEIRTWQAPFIMASINTKVVRRSNALLNFPYGEDFRYDESIMTGDGLSGRMKAFAIAVGLGLLMGGKRGSLRKRIVNRFLPNPGEGPSKRQRENGFFNISIYALGKDGKWIRGKITGDMDPGYGSTSKMLAEAAVCLAVDSDQSPSVSGILTPSVALGTPYLYRLTKYAGLTFEMID